MTGSGVTGSDVTGSDMTGEVNFSDLRSGIELVSTCCHLPTEFLSFFVGETSEIGLFIDCIGSLSIC